MGASSVNNSIRQLRLLQGEMTQSDLAAHVGVTRQTIIALERNKYSPSLELAFKISRVFNKNIEEVFHYGDNAH